PLSFRHERQSVWAKGQAKNLSTPLLAAGRSGKNNSITIHPGTFGAGEWRRTLAPCLLLQGREFRIGVIYGYPVCETRFGRIHPACGVELRLTDYAQRLQLPLEWSSAMRRSETVQTPHGVVFS